MTDRNNQTTNAYAFARCIEWLVIVTEYYCTRHSCE